MLAWPYAGTIAKRALGPAHMLPIYLPAGIWAFGDMQNSA